MVVDTSNLPVGWQWPSFEPMDVLGYLVNEKAKVVSSVAYRVWRSRDDLGLIPCGIDASDVAQGTWEGLIKAIQQQGKRFNTLIERPIAVIFNLARYSLVRENGKRARMLMTNSSTPVSKWTELSIELLTGMNDDGPDRNKHADKISATIVNQDASLLYDDPDLCDVVYEWMASDGSLLFPFSTLRVVAEIVDARKTGYLSSMSAIRNAIMSDDGWYVMALSCYHLDNQSIRLSLNPAKTKVNGRWVSIGWWYLDTVDNMYHLCFNKDEIPGTSIWSKMVKREDVQEMLDNLRLILVSETIKVR